MRYATLPLLAGISLAAISCTDQSPVGPSLVPGVQATRVTTPGTGPWARVVEGETGPGSLYALYIPTDWNGDAIYYAHGIRPPLEPITLRDQDSLFKVRDLLGAQGYAFAYSSFSENGLAVKDGAQRTHQLRALLNSELPDEPERSYLTGFSLGALVALDLAERFPGHYDGVLAMCGMVGGTPLELQYVGDVRALFDSYYPGVLPGNVISVPTPPMTIDELQARVLGAISASPQAVFGLYAIASTAQTPLAYAPVGSLTDPSSTAFRTLVGSLITALYYQLLGAPDVLDRAHGHSAYDNRNTVYTMGTPVIPALASVLGPMITASNRSASTGGVKRYDITPDAQNYVEKYYVPTGHLTIPVVSVHKSWDPLVPFFHEPAFAGIVDLAGASNMLLARTVQSYGHCDFETSVVMSSFQTLTNWVTTGVKPAA